MKTQNYPLSHRLVRYAARFSFFAPFAAYMIYIIIQQSQALLEAQAGLLRIADLALGICVLLLPILGFIFGIAALVATKRHGRKGIFGWAVAGTVICSVYLLFVALLIVIVHHHYATMPPNTVPKLN
jgi:hypothetical protein